MLGWLVRLLLVAVLFRIVIKALARVLPRQMGHASQSSGPTGRVPSQKQGALVRDPMCGTYVEPSHSVSTRSGDVMRYFCSENCRQAFLKSV